MRIENITKHSVIFITWQFSMFFSHRQKLYHYFQKKNLLAFKKEISLLTRMLSSRISTGRSLTVCRSLLPRGVYLVLGGVLSPGEVYLVPGVYLILGGVCSRGLSLLRVGCLLLGGMSAQGCLFLGVSAPGGGLPAPEGVCSGGWYPSMH